MVAFFFLFKPKTVVLQVPRKLFWKRPRGWWDNYPITTSLFLIRHRLEFGRMTGVYMCFIRSNMHILKYELLNLTLKTQIFIKKKKITQKPFLEPKRAISEFLFWRRSIRIRKITLPTYEHGLLIRRGSRQGLSGF